MKLIPLPNETIPVPLASWPVQAGFTSPAEDYTDGTLDLNAELIKNPAATFCVRVKGDSMSGADINEGDILVVDRSAEPVDGKVAVCILDGEFTVKRLAVRGKRVFLVPENEEFKEIEITEDNEFVVWGIVTYFIKEG